MLVNFFLFSLVFSKIQRIGTKVSPIRERLIDQLLLSSKSRNSESKSEIPDSELPDWMHIHKDLIQDTKLNDLKIPGAHDSTMNTGGYIIGPFINAQDLTITQLLESGVRFFDVRVRKPTNNRLVTYHVFNPIFAIGGLFDSIYLDEMMSEVSDFLVNHVEEIVVIKIKPSITSAQAATYEEDIIATIPEELKKLVLLNDENFNQKIGELQKNNKRFIIIYEKTDNQLPVKTKYFFSNKDEQYMLSRPPEAENYDALVKGLYEKLPNIAESLEKIVLLHWTITGGNIKSNTQQYVSNKAQFLENIVKLGTDNRRINVIEMDFCSKEKSKWIIELNLLQKA